MFSAATIKQHKCMAKICIDSALVTNLYQDDNLFTSNLLIKLTGCLQFYCY
jgi:hypothetical protein